VENLQQRIFVRSSFEFAYRLPLIKFRELYGQYGPEKANRFFDTLTVQKGTAKMLLDFSTAFLQVGFGIILLALYHPFFLVIGILLIAVLWIIFRFSFKDGLESSLKESTYKYKVASWLQEIARNRDSFRGKREFEYSLERNDGYASDYVRYREKHFGVMRKQYIQLVIFKVVITAALLLIGGFLVIQNQMNIGQFVAAEIVIVLLINSVEKIIFGLESFYDVLTSLEKIGQVTDLEITDLPEATPKPEVGLKIETDSVGFQYPGSEKNSLKDMNLTINQGEKVLITGMNGAGKSSLLRLLSGIVEPDTGSVYVTDDFMNRLTDDDYKAHIGTMLQGETLFEGTIRDNIVFGNHNIDNDDLKWALDNVGLTPFIKTFQNGLETEIRPGGHELSGSDVQKILLARAIVHRPGILFLEDPTQRMDESASDQIIDFILSPQHSWTVIAVSKHKGWREKSTRVIELSHGSINTDLKK
ncbi:MAG: ABC transporter ATP-binding protein, partial [Chitinophagaceae bacterium]